MVKVKKVLAFGLVIVVISQAVFIYAVQQCVELIRDGSFVTRKNEPEDIDLVTFIDGPAISKLGNKLELFKYPQSLYHYGIDAYLVAMYDHGDRKYPLYIGDRSYWMDAFDKTQRNRNGLRYPKGFLEIIY